MLIYIVSVLLWGISRNSTITLCSLIVLEDFWCSLILSYGLAFFVSEGFVFFPCT